MIPPSSVYNADHSVVLIAKSAQLSGAADMIFAAPGFSTFIFQLSTPHITPSLMTSWICLPFKVAATADVLNLPSPSQNLIFLVTNFFCSSVHFCSIGSKSHLASVMKARMTNVMWLCESR